MLKNPTTNAIKILSNKFISNLIPSITPNPISAINTEGIDSKKLSLNAFSGVNPSNNKTVVVIPLLLTPGITENSCPNPSKKAFFEFWISDFN